MREALEPFVQSALRFGPTDARALVQYDRAVFERFARRIRRLPWKQVTRKRGIGHESLFDTLVHILNVEEVWMVYIVRGRNSDEELEALFADARRKPKNWTEFGRYASRVWAGVEETVRSSTPRTLGRKVSVFWMPGDYTVRDALLQVSIEEAHHLGEVIGALWQEDTPPPEMTWLDTRRKLLNPAKRRRGGA